MIRVPDYGVGRGRGFTLIFACLASLFSGACLVLRSVVIRCEGDCFLSFSMA